MHLFFLNILFDLIVLFLPFIFSFYIPSCHLKKPSFSEQFPFLLSLFFERKKETVFSPTSCFLHFITKNFFFIENLCWLFFFWNFRFFFFKKKLFTFISTNATCSLFWMSVLPLYSLRLFILYPLLLFFVSPCFFLPFSPFQFFIFLALGLSVRLLHLWPFFTNFWIFVNFCKSVFFFFLFFSKIRFSMLPLFVGHVYIFRVLSCFLSLEKWFLQFSHFDFRV